MSAICHNRVFVEYFITAFIVYDDIPIFQQFLFYFSDAGVIFRNKSRGILLLLLFCLVHRNFFRSLCCMKTSSEFLQISSMSYPLLVRCNLKSFIVSVKCFSSLVFRK